MKQTDKLVREMADAADRMDNDIAVWFEEGYTAKEIVAAFALTVSDYVHMERVGDE